MGNGGTRDDELALVLIFIGPWPGLQVMMDGEWNENDG